MEKIFAAIICIMISLPGISQTNEEEKDAVKKVIQTAYVEGLQNEGNFDKIDKGFDPGFELLGVDKNNKLWRLSINDWKEKVKKGIKEGKYPKPEDKEVSIKFLFVDITGNAAVAKFEFYIGKKLEYIDYQSLYKFDDGWKIVSKIYQKM